MTCQRAVEYRESLSMDPSRIQAIDHVNLEAPAGSEDKLAWFYTQVGGLEQVADRGEEARRLCFRSARLEVRIRIVDNPKIDPIACRLTLVVRSLAEAAELLEERSVRYVRLSGLWSTDQRLGTLDPVGHRVELKQEWPLL